MSTKKNKTLFYNSKHVDISSILNSNNINLLNQSGGAGAGTTNNTKKQPVKKTKKIGKKSDIPSDSENNLDDNLSESSNDNDSVLSDKTGGAESSDDADDVDDVEEADEVEEVEADDIEAEEAEDVDEEDDGLDEEIEETEEANEEDEDGDKNDKNKDDNDNDNDNDIDNKKCYSKYATDKNDDELDLDEIFKDDEININKIGRMSKPILFKYEKVRILADRTRQLAQGAKPMIKNTTGLSDKEIALLELKHKIIPIKIQRPIPNSTSEEWGLKELEIPEYD
jgi:DNA-directed RNA polymerase subunit K/omega